LYSPRKGRCL